MPPVAEPSTKRLPAVTIEVLTVVRPAPAKRRSERMERRPFVVMFSVLVVPFAVTLVIVNGSLNMTPTEMVSVASPVLVIATLELFHAALPVIPSKSR